MPILEFRNDSRVQYHPNYAESRLNDLGTMQTMFATLLANKTLDSSDRAFYEKELSQVQLSISELRRNNQTAA